jgi:uncharacterized protein
MATVKCPTCGKRGDWFSDGYGPFCSRRCKLLDLGKWFGEQNRVSSPLTDEDLEQIAEAPPEKQAEDEP